LTISIPQKMKEKIQEIDKLMLLLTEMRKQIQELQDEQAADEAYVKLCEDYISHKEYDEHIFKHNRISRQIEMLLRTYALISTEMSKVCLKLM
jgi:hypothetical protein